MQPLPFGFLLTAVDALTVEYEQKAECDCRECVGVEDNIDQIAFFSVAIGIENHKDCHKRKDHDDEMNQSGTEFHPQRAHSLSAAQHSILRHSIPYYTREFCKCQWIFMRQAAVFVEFSGWRVTAAELWFSSQVCGSGVCGSHLIHFTQIFHKSAIAFFIYIWYNDCKLGLIRQIF